MTESFVFPPKFHYVLLTIAGLNAQIWITALNVSKIRGKTFTQAFMDEHFGVLHRGEIKEKVERGGSPDNGSGVYSKKLPYGDWYRFNVAQRIHLNYVENIGLATVSVLGAGLVKAEWGVGVGIAYMIGRYTQLYRRFLYGHYYKKQKGARNKGRILGIAICHIAALTGILMFASRFTK